LKLCRSPNNSPNPRTTEYSLDSGEVMGFCNMVHDVLKSQLSPWLEVFSSILQVLHFSGVAQLEVSSGAVAVAG
jgi:hypothetical protein